MADRLTAQTPSRSGERDFRYVSSAQEVIFGPGSLARLNEAVERWGWRRLMLCASRSMRASGLVGVIQAAVGERLAAVFGQVRPHVQDVQVSEALALAGTLGVDAVIGLGGGSAIGMAKAVAYALEERRAGAAPTPATPTAQPLIPVIAIPTTYAGSEMTSVFGITHTDEEPPRKVTVSHPRIAPKLVIYDPELTLDLSPELTASTGINALAHCIEALYSPTRHPLSTAAAVSGARHIHHALLVCYRHGSSLDARVEMLLAAHLAGFSLAGVSMALHHGLCHVLGGTAGVPHGIANSIILPHAVRFNAQAAAELLLPAAQAMGVTMEGQDPPAAVEALVQAIFNLVGQMGLPQRLRDAGVQEADLPRLARIAFQNRTVHNNPRPISDAGQIERLLREAW